ncbi:uncharacterized protein N7483_006837 [Penicillium malachiteum]|uniref:uncharacterized protein n=1 Tax=Penicillium malachiteum TaxID=1324776 RepID=UPI0025485075|nr:uncharacterized protein N7483_006837 [Penicillium malachiteum]KAJ5725480.1 hypothetical protein N7483_006837 [Penicillium malachiteum]
MRSGESDFLDGLEGTEIVTPAQPDFELPERTWVITTKLEEVSLSMHQEDLEDSIGPGFTATTSLCHLKSDDHQPPAFLRLYCQTPVIGTEWSLPQQRANQAAAFFEPAELSAFKTFMKHSCPVVPQLLGYDHTLQADTGIIPRGYKKASIL